MSGSAEPLWCSDRPAGLFPATTRTTPMTPTPTAVQVLRNSLDRFLAKDMKGWTELCDETVVAEFPFAPEGSPARIEGRAALYEYLRNYPSFIDVRKLPTLTAYSTNDPNVAIAEWSASGTVIGNGNGNPYEMR